MPHAWGCYSAETQGLLLSNSGAETLAALEGESQALSLAPVT